MDKLKTPLTVAILVLAIVVLSNQLLNLIIKMKYPVSGRITSKFGDRTHPITKQKSFHNGIDIAVPSGTDVISPEAGKVISVYSNSTGGNQLIIEHSNGFRTGYAHLQKSLVKVGDSVSKGQVVAKSGNTGASTGAHLHLTLRKAGALVNPELFFV